MLGDYPVFPIWLSTDMAASRAFSRDVLGIEPVREDALDGEAGPARIPHRWHISARGDAQHRGYGR
jgi:catechol 2,3-dioxygenase-like lactoylglutathione lyase family enzyme